MKDYQQEKKERAGQLADFTMSVVLALERITKQQWTLQSTDSENTNVFRTIEREDGLAISFNASWARSPDRIMIYAPLNDLQKFAPYQPKAVEITVSRAKSPEKIAKDIIRRLLPTAEKRYSVALANKQNHDDQCKITEMLKKKLEHYGLKEYGQQNPPELRMYGGQVSELKTYDSNDIKLELRNLTFKQVTQILAIIKVTEEKE